jgi:hypothetical protein
MARTRLLLYWPLAFGGAVPPTMPQLTSARRSGRLATTSVSLPGRPRYPVLVHRAAALLHAVFRPHLAMTPLRFANPSPPSGEDFHLQAVVHSRHTMKKPRTMPGLRFSFHDENISGAVNENAENSRREAAAPIGQTLEFDHVRIHTLIYREHCAAVSPRCECTISPTDLIQAAALFLPAVQPLSFQKR